MKRFLFACIAALLISCNGKKEYQKNLEDTIGLMEEAVNTSTAISGTYVEVWRTAIFDNEYNGKYCSDFNEALADHMLKVLKTDSFKELTMKMDKIDSLIVVLRDYPSSYKDAFDEVASIYSDVDAIYQMAKDPDGSLTTYSDKVMKSYDNTSKRIKTFKIKYAQPK